MPNPFFLRPFRFHPPFHGFFSGAVVGVGGQHGIVVLEDTVGIIVKVENVRRLLSRSCVAGGMMGITFFWRGRNPI